MGKLKNNPEQHDTNLNNNLINKLKLKIMEMKSFVKFGFFGISLLILNSCSSPNCSNSKDEYQNGYAAGKTVKLMGSSGSCSDYVNSYNDQSGRNTLHATDCYCEGYNDGLNGDPAKY